MYVRECLLFQQVEVEHSCMLGKMQSLNIIATKLQSKIVDFITKLPTTWSGYDTIFVVVDRHKKNGSLLSNKKD